MRNADSIIDVFHSQLHLMPFLKVFEEFLGPDSNFDQISSIFLANRLLASANLIWERELIGELKRLGMRLSKPIQMVKDLLGTPRASALVWEACAKLILLDSLCWPPFGSPDFHFLRSSNASATMPW
jgi:hypothetical protein